jgi:hypothetical protein
MITVRCSEGHPLMVHSVSNGLSKVSSRDHARFRQQPAIRKQPEH